MDWVMFWFIVSAVAHASLAIAFVTFGMGAYESYRAVVREAGRREQRDWLKAYGGWFDKKSF